MGFNKNLMVEIITVLEKRMKRDGINLFQNWFKDLHYTLPDEFKDESVTEKIYENYSHWIEGEVKKLEKETGLTWKVQTEDLNGVNERTRKVQLVIRHRLSDIALDLLDHR
ncbi:putative metal-dependent hydrolase [Evansella vedderi]|uniref:Metal-dependent hydrolase n=1 Tax=Evansella vedderi TaxID=38282 RepID=A0ABT9ZPD8_9BACI|nr:hypothetical protein [Evansella vedderi]MDQ0253102.1 putative metal-dependent hydrolase [Evansella vedderi]